MMTKYLRVKKRILLLTLIAGFAFIILTGNSGGGAMIAHVDGTMSTGGYGCTCHNYDTSTTVSVELDSAGVPVTSYMPGLSYTLKVTGTNTSVTLNLPKFGFQVTVVKSAGAGTSFAVFAGALGTTGLPTGVQYTAAAPGCGIDVLEHNMKLTATTGTGGTGTTYVMSGLPWTAPAAGSGTIVIYGCINAVTGTGGTIGDAWNNGSVSIAERGATSVAIIADNFSLMIFPNPVNNNLSLRLENAQAGSYSMRVFDLNGKNITK